MLKFFVGAKSEHFLATTGGIPFFEALMNDIKELLKLKGGPFF